MITYRICKVAEILSETKLLEDYAVEGAISGLPKPSPQADLYDMLEKSGMLHSFGAFNGEELVGFMTVIAYKAPHYGELIAVSESVFVSKAFRKTGAGTRLIRMAEDHSKSIGAKGLLVSAPMGGSLSRMMQNPKSGYRQTNEVFFRGFHE